MLHFLTSQPNIPLERVGYLLCILAVRGTWLTREEVCLLLWQEDTEPDVAKTRLRQLLYRTKQLGFEAAIQSQGQRLRLTTPSDVALFQEALHAQNWQHATELYTGSLLEGLAIYEPPEFDNWLEFERERLRGDFRHAVQASVEQNPEHAFQTLERALRLEPDDQALLQLVAQHPALQRVAQHPTLAARVRNLEQSALKSLGLEAAVTPLPKLGALPQITSQFVGQITSRFVGRQLELETLHQWFLQPENKVIGIVGLGGLGKTRLILEFLQRCSEKVLFVGLAPIVDVRLVPQVILEQLGIAHGHDPQATLLEVVRGQALTLVLDNLEHLLEVRDLIAQMLSVAVNLRLFYTSREVLGLHSERILELGGVPPLQPEFGLVAQDAAQIFVAAATRRQADFCLQETDFAPLEQIYQAVGGMPLGLELAASWTRVMTLEQIAQALQDDQSLLATNAPDLPERQRSFAAIFQASWQRLSLEEKSALGQLAWLQGQFDANFALEVTALKLPILLRLVNKSLVQRVQQRFFLHELIRQNAKQHLPETQRQALLERLFAWATHQAQTWSANCYTRRHAELSAKLEANHEHLRLALSQALQHAPQLGAAMAAHLWYFWYTRGHFEEGLRWLEQACAVPDLPLETELRLLVGFADMARQFARFAECHAAADRLESLSQTAQNAYFLADAQRLRGDVFLDQQNFTQAENCFRQARSAFADLDLERYNTTTHNLGIVVGILGDLLAAKSLLEESLGISRTMGDTAATIYALQNLADVVGNLGDVSLEKLLFTQSLELSRSTGDVHASARTIVGLAKNAKRQGQLKQAKSHLLEALETYHRTHYVFAMVGPLLELAELEAATFPERALGLVGWVQHYWQQSEIMPDEQQLHTIENIRAYSGLSAAQYHHFELLGERMRFEQVMLEVFSVQEPDKRQD